MKRKIAIMLLVAIGLGFYLFPAASEWFKLRNDYGVDTSAKQLADSRTEITNATLLENAVAYNKKLWATKVHTMFFEEDATGDLLYQKQLRDPSQAVNRLLDTGEPYVPSALTSHDAMARVSIPKVEISMPVFHGTADAALAKGAGHVYGTSLPVGGPSTHTVITAHSRQGRAGRFNRIRELQIGDEFFITTAGQTMRYVVDRINTVLPDEVEYLEIVPGQDYATLLTCTPLGLNTHRLLVRGIRAPLENVAAATEVRPMPFPAWAVWLGAGLSAAFLVCLALDKVTKPRANKTQPEMPKSTWPAQNAVASYDGNPKGRHLRVVS